MTALLWSPDAPTRCACAGAYRPKLNAKGRLVKANDPAWSMAEQTRDPGCLQEQFRALARVYGLEYQHHGDSRKSGAGYPDVHLWARDRGSAFVELKRMRRDERNGRDDPTPFQVRRMTSLQKAGHRVYLARPCCLLVGAVDELMAELAGAPCRYIKGHPDGGMSQPVVLEVAAPPAAARAVRPRPEPVLPGTEVGESFPAAAGYIVPMPAGETAAAAVRQLEAWLREAGFPAANVPFPMRIVAGDGVVVVQVRAGLARPGNDVRVWRGGVPARPFPEHLVDAVNADVVAGPSSDKVAWLIETVPHSGTLGDEVSASALST